MKTEQKPINKPKGSKYDINSGYIFTELQYSFNNFSKEFLLDQVWEAYRKLVSNIPLISYSATEDEGAAAYIKNLEFRYNRDVVNLSDLIEFPFPKYHLFYNGGEPIAVGMFEDRYVVKLEDPYFDLFFVLKMLQTDVMGLQQFLQFQLQNSFQNQPDFVSFLKAVSSKYADLLEARHTPLIKDFIDSLTTKNVSDVEDRRSHPDFTLNRQVLFMYYLLNKAGVEKTVVDTTEMARIIQGITSRQLGAKNIVNTDIYKRLKNPLKDNSKGSFKSDLVFVRNLFEKLSLNDVVDEINKEINHLD